jgi:predicted Zn finger-like uncharacterized protein
MKITCQACQAKYTIADEKVAGKVVKIRCKKCGATIVVNGNDASAGSSQPPELGGAADDAAHGHTHDRWSVHVNEGDERTMAETEIVAAYVAGVVSDDTFCWKEGMADWLPVVEIAGLHAACTAPGAASAGGDFPGKSQDAGTPGAGTNASAPPSPPRVSKPPSKERNGAPASSNAGSPGATAARRVGGRAAAADLFGGVAQAGGEDEVMTSAPPAVSQAHADAQKAGGARADHRGDGLASKDSHDRGGATAPSMTATTEASGLIDIRQLGAQMRSSPEEKKKSRVDDIMNLGGGGAFSPSLAAPVLSAPSLEHYSSPPPGLLSGPVATQVKSNALIIVVACAGLFFLVAAVGVAVLVFRGPTVVDDRDRTSASAGGPASTSGSVAANGSAAAAVQAPQPSAARAPEAAGSVPVPSESASAAAQAPGAAKEAPADNTAPHPAVAAAGPKPFVAPAAPKDTPPAAPSGAEFNLGEARARLGAISGGVQTCKRGDTAGAGKVEIVFGPSGAAQSATLMGGSPFDGTPTGKCVEARFRQARVPPFTGSPVPVTKSFTIN